MEEKFFEEEVRCDYVVTKKKKQLWSVQLDLLEQFKAICEKHDLQYYILYGTLLGAVRHQGFIPWDDDIDVALLRDDYDKFLQIAQEELRSPYTLQTKENTEDFFHGSLSRLGNNHTFAMSQKDLGKKCNFGIFIDILALDAVPDDKEEQKRFLENVNFYQKLLTVKTNLKKYYEVYDEKIETNRNKELCTELEMTAKEWLQYAELAESVSKEELCRRFNAVCTRYNNRTTKLTSFSSMIHSEQHLFLEREDFAKSISLTFEGMKLHAPAGYIRCLQVLKGQEYMDFPKEEDRKNSHFELYSVEQPYEKYLDHYLAIFEQCKGKPIVLFGAGATFSIYMERFGKDYTPLFIVDNSSSKWGSEMQGIPVKSPEAILEAKKEYPDLQVIIGNICYREIGEQLQQMGIKDYYVFVHDSNSLWWFLQRGLGEDKTLPTKKVALLGTKGKSINADNGQLIATTDEYLVTEPIYHAYAGDRLHLLQDDYLYQTVIYSTTYDEKYMFSPNFAMEENWATYEKNSLADFGKEDYIFPEECYFRVIDKRDMPGNFSGLEEGHLEDILQFTTSEKKGPDKGYFQKEVQGTVDRLKTIADNAEDENILTVALLADSHRMVNGTWEDTIQNVCAVNGELRRKSGKGFDAVVHLGDLTDGSVSKKVTSCYVTEMIEDMAAMGKPVYITIGNHDMNGFAGEKESLSKKEQFRLYQRKSALSANVEEENTYYYADYEDVKLRMFFLDSCALGEKPEEGFSDEELQWVKRTLGTIPEGYRALFFSHIAPLKRLDYFAEDIRNGEKLVTMLEHWMEQTGGCILGFIHGHTHADYVYQERRFPIISIGCCKCEYFEELKPAGSVCYKRERNTGMQDLWDSLVITEKSKELVFVRFGAGKDRSV